MNRRGIETVFGMLPTDYGNRQPVDFYTNLENHPLNSCLILAQMLSGRGVSINPQAIDNKGRSMQGYVQIIASSEGKRILRKMENTPELQILAAYPYSPMSKLVDSLPWDEATKIRVKALILQREADHQAGDGYFWRQWTQEAKEMLKTSGLAALTPDDIRGLLEPVVARVLSETPV